MSCPCRWHAQMRRISRHPATRKLYFRPSTSPLIVYGLFLLVPLPLVPVSSDHSTICWWMVPAACELELHPVSLLVAQSALRRLRAAVGRLPTCRSS